MKTENSDIQNTDSISGEDFAEDRSNDKRCGSNLLGLKIGQSGVIESPNYPLDPYPGGLECLHTISASKGKVITLEIDDLDMEPEKDFILVR